MNNRTPIIPLPMERIRDVNGVMLMQISYYQDFGTLPQAWDMYYIRGVKYEVVESQQLGDLISTLVRAI